MFKPESYHWNVYFRFLKVYLGLRVSRLTKRYPALFLFALFIAFIWSGLILVLKGIDEVYKPNELSPPWISVGVALGLLGIICFILGLHLVRVRND